MTQFEDGPSPFHTAVKWENATKWSGSASKIQRTTSSLIQTKFSQPVIRRAGLRCMALVRPMIAEARSGSGGMEFWLLELQFEKFLRITAVYFSSFRLRQV